MSSQDWTKCIPILSAMIIWWRHLDGWISCFALLKEYFFRFLLLISPKKKGSVQVVLWPFWSLICLLIAFSLAGTIRGQWVLELEWSHLLFWTEWCCQDLRLLDNDSCLPFPLSRGCAKQLGINTTELTREMVRMLAQLHMAAKNTARGIKIVLRLWCEYYYSLRASCLGHSSFNHVDFTDNRIPSLRTDFSRLNSISLARGPPIRFTMFLLKPFSRSAIRLERSQGN